MKAALVEPGHSESYGAWDLINEVCVCVFLSASRESVWISFRATGSRNIRFYIAQTSLPLERFPFRILRSIIQSALILS